LKEGGPANFIIIS